MGGFKGQASFSVDEKGRVAIPARMRRKLRPEAQSTFVVVRGLDRCVFLYPLDEWAAVEERIGALNPYDAETRAFTRLVMMFAEEVQLDGQGRIRLPAPLMALASITRDALILGHHDHIEIWDPEQFATYLQEQAQDYEALAARAMKG